MWTLVEGDWDLVGEKVGAGRLGFVLILKFYEIEGRFPAYLEEIPAAAVEYVASLVEVEPGLLAKYSWRSRTIERHRAQIRKRFGTRPATEDDEERLAQWLADKVCPVETNRDRLAGAARERCRSTSIEPPTSGQVERVVNSGCRRFEEAFAEQVMARLGPIVCARLEELLGRPHVLAELKSDPGPLGLDTLLVEIGKLATARFPGLGEAVFSEISDQIVAAWRGRAMRMYPSDFAACSPPVRNTLLAALCWTRQAELVDGLVELLTGPLQGDVADAGPLEVVEAVALVQGEDVLEGADTNTRTWARATGPVRRPTSEPPGPALPWSGNPRDRPCEPGAPESAPGGPYSTRDLSRACGRPPISRPGPLVPVTGCR